MEKTVGYYVSEKKAKKLNFSKLTERFWKSARIKLVALDLERDLSEQGPFDAIFHKVSDLLIQADHGNEAASLKCRRLQEFLNDHSDIIVIDPLPSVRLLCHRYLQYWLLRSIATHDGILTPNFVDLISGDVSENKGKIARAGVTYPMVVKPLLSHGLAFTHQMSVVFSDRGLSEVEVPCVAQSFVPHNAVLYKVFVLGDFHFVISRPSLKNLEPGEDTSTIFFDSHELSKDGCEHHLSKMEGPMEGECVPPNTKRIGAAVKSLRQCTGLSMFGMDIIVENNSDRCYCIDVNPFPSYDGVEDFPGHLMNYIRDRLDARARARSNSAVVAGTQTQFEAPGVNSSRSYGDLETRLVMDEIMTKSGPSLSGGVASGAEDGSKSSTMPVVDSTPRIPTLVKIPPNLIPLNSDARAFLNGGEGVLMTTTAGLPIPPNSHGRSLSDMIVDYGTSEGFSTSTVVPTMAALSTTSGRGGSPFDSGIGSASESEASDSEKKMKALALKSQTGTSGSTSITEIDTGLACKAESSADFGSKSFFPSWKRIKRFYGIPKPPKLAGISKPEKNMLGGVSPLAIASRSKTTAKREMDVEFSKLELKCLVPSPGESACQASVTKVEDSDNTEVDCEGKVTLLELNQETKKRSETIP